MILLPRYRSRKMMCNRDGSVPMFIALESCISRLCRFRCRGAYKRSFLTRGQKVVLSLDQNACWIGLVVMLKRCLRCAFPICRSRPITTRRHKPPTEYHSRLVTRSSVPSRTPLRPVKYPGVVEFDSLKLTPFRPVVKGATNVDFAYAKSAVSFAAEAIAYDLTRC